MSTTLSALKTKLDSQQQELQMHIGELEHEIRLLEQESNTLKHTLDQQKKPGSQIHPELEMNRLNFMMKTCERIEHQHIRINDLNATKKTLESKLERLRIERKLLGKYMQRTIDAQKSTAQKEEEHRMDEWALLNKESA